MCPWTRMERSGRKMQGMCSSHFGSVFIYWAGVFIFRCGLWVWGEPSENKKPKLKQNKKKISLHIFLEEVWKINSYATQQTTFRLQFMIVYCMHTVIYKSNFYNITSCRLHNIIYKVCLLTCITLQISSTFIYSAPLSPSPTSLFSVIPYISVFFKLSPIFLCLVISKSLCSVIFHSSLQDELLPIYVYNISATKCNLIIIIVGD